jgi:hypothetical protein
LAEAEWLRSDERRYCTPTRENNRGMPMAFVSVKLLVPAWPNRES